MQILYLCHRIPYPPNKGDKIRSFNEIRYLSKFHKVDLAALVDDPGDFAYEKELSKYCRRTALARLYPLWGKMKGLLSLCRNSAISVGYFYSAELQKTVDDWLGSTAYDAVVCFSSPMAEYVFKSRTYRKKIGALGKSGMRPRFIMDFCDLDSDKWRQYAKQCGFPFSLVYRMEGIRLLKYETRINRAFDASVFISHQEVRLYADYDPRAVNLHVIPNGVDHEYFSPGKTEKAPTPRKGPVLVFTGAMDYSANADGVCWFCREILPDIKEKHPSALFYIVGSNPLDRVRELERLEGVHVTGFVEDIRPYYEMADVCVIPLRVARGVQNKVLEAMSMAKPAVATPAAVQGIGPDCTGNLLVADGPKNFARSVLQLLENRKTGENFGVKARRFVMDRFDWETNMHTLESLLIK